MTEKIDVPIEWKDFASSWRWGYRMGFGKCRSESRGVFVSDTAYRAYLAGYRAGLANAPNSAEQVPRATSTVIDLPLFKQ